MSVCVYIGHPFIEFSLEIEIAGLGSNVYGPSITSQQFLFIVSLQIYLLFAENLLWL